MAAKKKAPAPTTAADTNDIAKWVPESELELWDANPRDNDAAVPKVADSIRRYGFVAPVVVWTSRRQLVAGHTRLKALRAILAADATFVAKGAPGPGMVPVRFHEFESEAEASAYAIADNRLGYEADWDYEKLVPLLESIKTDDAALLSVTGFHDDELNALMRSVYSAESASIPPTNADAEAAGEETKPHASKPKDAKGGTLELSAGEWAVLRKVVLARTGMVSDDAKALRDGLIVLLNELAAEVDLDAADASSDAAEKRAAHASLLPAGSEA